MRRSLAPVRWALGAAALLLLQACSVHAMPAAMRLYASDVRITAIDDEEYEDQHIVRMDLDVFQAAAGGFVYDLREQRNDGEQLLVLDGFVPPSEILLAQIQGLNEKYDDQHTDPREAIDDALDALTNQFQLVEATLFANFGSEIVRRDMIINEAQYDEEDAELVLLVEFASNRSQLELNGASSNPAWNSTIIECGAGEDEDGVRYDCAALGRALEAYDGVLEMRPKFVRAKKLSGEEKLKECSASRLVEMSCYGKSCSRVLPALGVDYGWTMKTAGYSGVVTGEQCCLLMDKCRMFEAGSAGNAASCGVNDGGENVGMGWGMVVGDAGKDPLGESFQAQCNPNCGMEGNAGKWRECRWDRLRCPYNCRCSWWC